MAWTVFIDGGSRGNPGPAGAGVHITDDNRNVVFSGGFALGRMTNNQAEYQGLIKALELLVKAGAPEATIYTDSELMAHQLNGRYRVKSPDLKPLFEHARSLLSRLADWHVQHVRRERNAKADGLANEAMDAGGDVIHVNRIRSNPTPSPAQERPVLESAAPLPVVEVKVASDPGHPSCNVRRGQSFQFSKTTPGGMCVHGCAAVLDAVLSMQESMRRGVCIDARITCRCTRPGCQAVFELSPRQ